MLVIQVAGGLGNQLQQYAMYEKLKSLGKDVALDTSWFYEEKPGKYERNLELSYFPHINYRQASPEEILALRGAEDFVSKVRRKLFRGNSKLFVESKMYHPEIFDFTDKYMMGYFACEKYYADIMPELRHKLQFPPSTNMRNKELAEEMQERESVSIHIRRGDYLDKENAALFGGICTDEYYQGAIREMKQLFPDAHFYIFSNDPEYAYAEYSGDEYTVVDVNWGKDSFFDIYLMSCCRHNICANSTFSFWGARLNQYSDKVVIRPSIHKNTQTYIPELMHDLWEGWVLMDSKGRIV